jgi:hypothetical protein
LNRLAVRACNKRAGDALADALNDEEVCVCLFFNGGNAVGVAKSSFRCGDEAFVFMAFGSDSVLCYLCCSNFWRRNPRYRNSHSQMHAFCWKAITQD